MTSSHNSCSTGVAEMPFGREVFILACSRTPIGAFQGSLAQFSATDLCATAFRDVLKKVAMVGERSASVDEVIVGHVLSAGCGQAPATQAAQKAGIPDSVPAWSVNKVCASGMKAVMLGAQAIRSGAADMILAGGMESMSNAPYLMPPAARTGGMRFGPQTLTDSLQKDGLLDAPTGLIMGDCAEKCVADHGITRAAQDAFAKSSFERAIEATNQGYLAKEIVSVAVPASRTKPASVIDRDESLAGYNPAKMASLKPVFKAEGGTVTAANASSLSDGASAVLLASRRRILELGLSQHVIARVIADADASCASVDFTIAPSLAIPKALATARLEISQIDYFEINEAFAAVLLANMERLKIPAEKCNVFGGAIAIGHPLGCSGARIIGTLCNVLHTKNSKYGVAAVCNGGGGASAIVIERLTGLPNHPAHI